ncbi:MAG: LPPG:FO 2-phospho-L-lactate transferase [Elusimicrobia bacterium]|nr:MAG: LPPG:FO 2-phospho-L-lactate transferase [Elusimicrobiota bacterium]
MSGPAGKLMAAKGLPVSALGVAQLYRPWLDVLALDRRDEGLAPDVAALGIAPLVTGTIMTDRRAEAALARAVVEALLAS